MKKVLGMIMIAALAVGLAACGKTLKADDTPVENLVLKSGTLKVGMNLQNPPMESLDEEAKPVGFDVEVIQAVGDKLGLQLEIVDTTEENLLPSLGAKVYDCAISTIPITEENQKDYYVTGAYADITSVKNQMQNKDANGKLGIFVSRKNGQLMLRIEDALEALQKEGKMTEISRKFFDTDITKGMQ